MNNKVRRIRGINMDEKGTQGRRTLRSPFHFGFTEDGIKAFKRHPKSRLRFNRDKATNFRIHLHSKAINWSCYHVIGRKKIRVSIRSKNERVM